MIHPKQFASILFGLALSLSLIGCVESSTETTKELNFSLPEGWQVFEDIHVNEQHRKINIATSQGSIVGLELLIGDNATQFDSNTYLKRYMDSALPTEEIKASAVIDLGEIEREGQHGYFANVTVPSPANVEFVIDLYQYAGHRKTLFVVLNTPPDVLEELQPEIDYFIRSISLGE